MDLWKYVDLEEAIEWKGVVSYCRLKWNKKLGKCKDLL